MLPTAPMRTLILSSPGPNAGKTTLAVALGQRLLRLGRRVTYRRFPGPGSAEDGRFVRAALQLPEPVASILSTTDQLDQLPEVDVLLAEAGRVEAASELARAPGAIPLIIARFHVDQLAETILRHAEAAGVADALVLINVVPEKGQRQLRQRVIPALESHGLRVIGILPQDRTLLGTTVGELATALNADILCAHDQLHLPVESVMIAAMSDEGAEEYFRRRDRKVVVAAGDRPDIHMPALATDTSCIVLTRGLDPDPTVFKTAAEQGVPLLKVSADTFTVLDQIADHFYDVRFRQRYKIAPAVALLRAHLDEVALFMALGLDGTGGS